MIWIYNILLSLGSLLWVPWMILRARKRKEPVDWKERSGDYRFKLPKGVPRLWLHAVSVGEVMAALPILREVRTQAPNLEIVLSVTTSSGHKTASEKAEGLFDHLVYYPIDVYRFVLAALVRIRPSVVAVMETELWMNFLDASHNMGVKTLLVNGRISDRSFPRAKVFGFFYRDLLRRMDRCLMQTATDADRIRELGGQSVEIYGNCKFDEALQGVEADGEHWRKELGLDPTVPVIVVGSTRSEIEEHLIVQAIKELRVQVLWAPRHLERAEPLQRTLTQEGISVKRRTVDARLAPVPDLSTSQELRSTSIAEGGVPQVLLIDTYGELSAIYSVADIVVIGGGFDRLGGQNLIQPLAHGKPVLHGPHMQNFKDVSQAALLAGATEVVSTSGELLAALKKLLADEEERTRRGKAAQKLVRANVGASRRYAEAIVEASKAPDPWKPRT